MNIEITTWNYKLISSWVCFLLSNETNILNVDWVEMYIIFEDDSSKWSRQITYKVEDNIIKMILINFNWLVEWLTDIIELPMSKNENWIDKKIYFTFYVTTFTDKKLRKLDYSFYITK